MRTLTKMVRWWHRGGVPPATGHPYLTPATQMWAMLERERLRADRNESVFSLLTFDVSAVNCEPLAAVMQRRLRNTDVAGFLRSDQLGVFLPDTPAAGAETVARDLLALLKADMPHPDFDIYVYPQPWWPEDNAPEEEPAQIEHHVHLGNGHAAENGRHINGQRAIDDPLRRVNGSAGGSSKGQVLRAQSQQTESTRALPLRALYAQPMPLWKRAIDIAGAIVGITLLSPVLAATAVGVRLTSPGPAIYRQQRAGLGGRAFTIWKFRTMCDRADTKQADIMHLNEQDGAAFKIKNDPRITTLGNFLRKTSIDEFPQLWNVLRGEMSLVGPRPLPLHEADACEVWQQRRLDVTPGVTCIWQVQGRSAVKFDEWMRMDLQYAHKRTMWGDLKLIEKTIPAVLMRRGAS